ncbi:MAG: hypothetical protein NWS20_06065 [Rickettsiaceae bacterium]|nr:hypothetical protein [Rickettsiaceae bacterium]
MEDIRFKDIRVLSTPLDLKNNADKTLSEIFRQLQSGFILKGLVVGNTPKGEIIFHTSYGRFAAPNPLNLEKGDTINIKLSLGDKVVTGSIVAVNNKQVVLEESLKLDLVRQPHAPTENASNKSLDSPVSIRNASNVPKSIIGEISYLNLSKINKASMLSTALSNNTLPTGTKIPVSINIITNDKPTANAFVVNGIVSGAAKLQGQQLIKTEFGIITTQSTNMPIGQRLSLELTSINNKTLGSDLIKNITDFIFNINKEWLSVKNIGLSLQNNKPTPAPSQGITGSATEKAAQPIIDRQTALTTQMQTTVSTATHSLNNNIAPKSSHSPDVFKAQEAIQKLPVAQTTLEAKLLSDNVANLSRTIIKNTRKNDSPNNNSIVENRKNARNELVASNNTKLSGSNSEKLESQSINSIIKSLADNTKIKQLSTEFHNIKELLTSSIKENADAEKLQTVFIPFYDGQQIKEYEVKLDRTREHFLRFTFDVNLESNPMQIDGLIKFENDDKTPRAFDLTIRSKYIIPNTLQQRIAEIYNINQNMTGIRGNFTIENEAPSS